MLVVGLLQAKDLLAQPPLENLPAPHPEAAGAPPQLYVPDPLDAGGFSGIASGIEIDPSPTWPRWFAGANGLVMTRTLPAGTATMQPVAGLQPVDVQFLLPGHCTGWRAVHALANAYGDRVSQSAIGTTYRFAAQAAATQDVSPR